MLTHKLLLNQKRNDKPTLVIQINVKDSNNNPYFIIQDEYANTILYTSEIFSENKTYILNTISCDIDKSYFIEFLGGANENYFINEESGIERYMGTGRGFFFYIRDNNPTIHITIG